ncbi:MAG: RNA methyltransferase [Bacteroidota bacterium]
MLSKNQISFINSLKLKKYRDKHGLFIAEGEKIVIELFSSSFKIHSIYAIKNWIKKISDIPELFGTNKNLALPAQGGPALGGNFELFEVTEKELKRISSQTTPNEVLCTVKIPAYKLELREIMCSLNLVLDNIQDPGNLGTIIRIADWFGIKNIICSKDCADAYNPKVVQATMGSVARVKVHYIELKDFLLNVSKKTNLPVYASILDGESIYELQLSNKGLIIMGNESIGISEKILHFITDKISIPSFGGAESLNVAVATAIVCSEFRRKQY